LSTNPKTQQANLMTIPGEARAPGKSLTSHPGITINEKRVMEISATKGQILL